MLSDTDELKAALREQVENDVADFIASLQEPESMGVPPPPRIDIDEVSAQPADVEFTPFGGQQTAVTQGAPSPPPTPTIGVCCHCDGTCDDSVTVDTCIGCCSCSGGACEEGVTNQTDCESTNGCHWTSYSWKSGASCSDNPCVTGACCVTNDLIGGLGCTTVTSSQCDALLGTYQGDGVPCTPWPCGGGACCVDDLIAGYPFCYMETDGVSCVDGPYSGFLPEWGGDGTECINIEPWPCPSDAQCDNPYGNQGCRCSFGGACCDPDFGCCGPDGFCVIESIFLCGEEGYQGDGTPCPSCE